MTRIARAGVHFAARRVAPRLLGRFALLRLLPSGLVAALLAEGLLLAWRELGKRPALRGTIGRALRTALSRR